ncbi:DUF262 domain-containing protein [Treponema pectinovorum]|uniref:DUF262 domain-containing protein n=1 Tax=Treponema pectinovorum TaxID=164 RepID=UPI0011C6F5E3|nr:DUF262 domain-containing protein [Treponema pectinovorum]
MAKNIEPNLKLISDYLTINEDEKFVIPEYQRGYSWEITQCDKLWQDITNFIESENSEPYFFGTVIINCSNETNELNLIDGQQRTTTFLLLLKALQLRLSYVIDNFKSDSDSKALKNVLVKKLDKTLNILFNANDDLIEEIKVDWNKVKNRTILINNSINELYKDELQKIISAKTYDEAEEIVYKIPRKQKDNKYTNHFRNFKFFYDRLVNYSESNIKVFAESFLEKCQIIEIKSWQIAQAITMFNSLNSTGLPLSDADIISAQMYSFAEDNKADFNESWEAITKLANKLSLRKITDIDGVLQQNMYIQRAVTKEYMRTGTPDVTTPGLRKYYLELNKESLRNPRKLCSSFDKIVQIWDKIKDYPVIKLLLKFNENIKIYLIAYLFRFELKEIDQKNIEEIAESLIKLFAVLELVDTGFSSNSFKTFLFGENVKFVDSQVNISEIQNDFNVHICKTWKKEDLTSSLEEYNKNVLIFLNEYLYTKEKGKNFDFEENVNIEHIMPVSGKNIETIRVDAKISDPKEFDSVVNKIGNKILLEEDINKSISNDWFKTKKLSSVKDKLGYKDSKYNIASALVSYHKDKWEISDIEIATNKAAKRIVDFIFS